MSVLDACEFFVMYRLLAFPIVDADNRLLGVVDVSLFTDEMMDVADRQSKPDAPDVEAPDPPPLLRRRARSRSILQSTREHSPSRVGWRSTCSRARTRARRFR